MGDFVNVEWVNRARHTKIHGHVTIPVQTTRVIGSTEDGKPIRELTGEVRQETYKLGTPAKMILLLLAMHAHDDGTHAYPSAATLAEQSELEEREVRRQLDRLEAGGWITPHGISDSGTVMYKLNLKPVPEKKPRGKRAKGDTGNRGGESTNPPVGEIPIPPIGESPIQINKGTNKGISFPPAAAFPSASLNVFGYTDREVIEFNVARMCGRKWSGETESQRRDLEQAASDLLRLGATVDDVCDWYGDSPGDETLQPQDVVRGVEERLRAKQAPKVEQPGWRVEATQQAPREHERQAEPPVIVDKHPEPGIVSPLPKMRIWNGRSPDSEAWKAAGENWGDFLKLAEEHGEPFSPPQQRTRAELLQA